MQLEKEYMGEIEKLKKYISVVPSERQKIIQEMRFYAFVHFTVNTFTGKEWGNGKESPNIFNPKSLNTDQWCEAIKSAGMKGVILTCKHHDGFCLWQTETTNHSIKNSPYKQGKGDIVKELSESCIKYGLKMGVYLSPWDRNSEYYGTDKYMDFYIAQLSELLSNYGEIFMLWLDGACASNLDGKPKQEYDFKRIYETALSFQPNIVISNCGPDIRWVGNESGKARDSEWNVVPSFQFAEQNIENDSQKQEDSKQFKKRCVDVMIKDMGSREFLAKFDNFVWYPAEVDVSIRPGWFYHPIENIAIRSLKNLMKIYYSSVGGNSLLLLNIPPNRKGLLSPKDVSRLKQIGMCLKKDEENIVPIKSYTTDTPSKIGFGINNLVVNKAFSPVELSEKYEIVATFEKTSIDRVVLREDTDFSQRVEKFKIYADTNGAKELLYEGTVIGFNKIAIFKPICTNMLILVIEKSRFEPYINYFKILKTGGFRFSR